MVMMHVRRNPNTAPARASFISDSYFIATAYKFQLFLLKFLIMTIIVSYLVHFWYMYAAIQPITASNIPFMSCSARSDMVYCCIQKRNRCPYGAKKHDHHGRKTCFRLRFSDCERRIFPFYTMIGSPTAYFPRLCAAFSLLKRSDEQRR